MKMKALNILLVNVVILTLLQDQINGFLWSSRRRRCGAVNCLVGSWSSWSGCTHDCGNAGEQRRTRTKTRAESCGGRCYYRLVESRSCNRDACKNGGTPEYGRCSCSSGWTGTCCQTDVDECVLYRPCQHTCTNVPGSYTCQCRSCYTKLGDKCELRQCKINGNCYGYGDVNPANQCQDCQERRKTAWTNNHRLPCSDNILCTKDDICVNRVCTGTPFTCLECESCDGRGCRINPGFCVVNGMCYRHGDLRPGKPCQECNSNIPTKWTANNNLVCSDYNAMTRNDCCINGECRGEPFSCLSCQDHHNDTCRTKPGYCIINHNNIDTCFTANVEKPGNSCQWCFPGTSTTTWTNKNAVPCDDGDNCTKSDTCKSGQCAGIPFTCNNDCQYCNGSDCSLHPGYGYVLNQCACTIGGRDFSHQQFNPDNECQWCDVYDKASKAILAWSNRPSVPCNDNNACTKQDLCKNGRCEGREYTCQASYPQSSCIQRSECVGDGSCRDIMKTNRTICRAAVDQCDQPERCDGVLGTCPPRTVDPIHVKIGQARLTHRTFGIPIKYQSSTKRLFLKLSDFSSTCGSLTVRWSLLKGHETCRLNMSNETLSSTANNHILVGLSLQNKRTYKVAVQVYNIRKQFDLPVCSNTVTIDTVTP